MRAVLLLLFIVASAAGAARADAPVLVYVNDVVVTDAALAADAGALTGAMCAALAKDKRLDVMCAPDVKQLLAFAASSSMLGSSAPAADSLQRRVDATRFVVSAQLVAGKGTTTLAATIGAKDESSTMGAMSATTTLARVDETSSARATSLLERLPGVARRLVDAALAPTSLAPTSTATPSTAPPAPLSAPAKKP
jgi:hypothetical protein